MTHRCHIIEMRGESYRLKDAKKVAQERNRSGRRNGILNAPLKGH
jgi:hypothetical protein